VVKGLVEQQKFRCSVCWSISQSTVFQSDVRTIDPTVVQSTTSWHDGSVQNWSVGRSVGQSIMVRQPVGQSGGNSFNSHLDINWQVKRLTSITLLSLLVLRFIISGLVGQSINETSTVRFSINLSTFTKKKSFGFLLSLSPFQSLKWFFFFFFY
jgi:hypothetical protein